MIAAWSLWRKPLLYCPLAGWLAGMLWWTGLMIAFGPSTVVTLEQGVVQERRQSVASRVAFAPVIAVPWVAVWSLVGVANAQFRGWWVPVVAAVGMIAGGAYTAAVNYFDGWLAVLMPLGCLGGTIAGTVVGSVTRACWGWLYGWEDSL